MIRLAAAIWCPLEGFSAFSASALVQKIQLRPEPDTRPQRPATLRVPSRRFDQQQAPTFESSLKIRTKKNAVLIELNCQTATTEVKVEWIKL
jgi:hypothetical protein